MDKRGFTLIELLVVISIIGLLSSIVMASLNTARTKARDVRRMQDLAQLDRAITSFFSDKGYLPANTNGWCTYISNTTNGYTTTFQSNFIPGYMPSLPADPQKQGQVGDYFYRNENNGQGLYTLCAQLEQSTGKTYDYSACNGGMVYNYCIKKQ